MPGTLARLRSVLAAAAVVLATAATAEPSATRQALADAFCGEAAGIAAASVKHLGALADSGVEEARWTRQLARAALDRKLACGGPMALIETSSGVVDAATGEAKTSPADARGVVLNLKSRAAVETLEAAAVLLGGTTVAERTAALKSLERRIDTVPSAVLQKAAEAETDAALKGAIETQQQASELRSSDPAKRIAAVERLAANPTIRASTQLRALTGDAAYKSDPAFRKAVDDSIAKVDRWVGLTSVLTILYNGLSLASILFMAAVGLAIIFGLMGVINLAQGEFIMLGAYVTYLVQEAFRRFLPGLLDWYLLAAVPVVILVVGAVGMLIEVLLIRHFYRRPLMSLLATWAVSLFLINIVRVVFGTQNLHFEMPFYVSGGFQVFGDFIVTWNRLFAIAFAAATLAVTAYVLRGTPLGLNIRAVTLNRDMAGCIGIRTRRVDSLAFAFGSALAGLAGLALSPIYSVNPQMGTLFVIDSFMVVVLGGVGTLTGTVLASLGVGQINVAIEPLYGAVAAKVIVLLMIIAFLQWRPEGLFAVKGRRK
jgi:urea transport system permease protein